MNPNVIETINAKKPNFKIDEVLNVLKYRFATKQFDASKIISDDVFNALLESARLAPTSMGFEPWKMIVVQDKDVRNKLKEFAWGASRQLDSASHFIVFIANKRDDVTFGSAHIDHVLKDIHQIPDDVYEFFKKSYIDFSTKDFKTLESERSAFDWSAKQAYVVMVNMMTAAAFWGVDSCVMEGFIQKEFDRILGEELKLYDTKHYSSAVTLALGYRLEQPPRNKTRRPLEESVIWK